MLSHLGSPLAPVKFDLQPLADENKPTETAKNSCRQDSEELEEGQVVDDPVSQVNDNSNSSSGSSSVSNIAAQKGEPYSPLPTATAAPTPSSAQSRPQQQQQSRVKSEQQNIPTAKSLSEQKPTVPKQRAVSKERKVESSKKPASSPSKRIGAHVIGNNNNTSINEGQTSGTCRRLLELPVKEDIPTTKPPKVRRVGEESSTGKSEKKEEKKDDGGKSEHVSKKEKKKSKDKKRVTECACDTSDLRSTANRGCQAGKSCRCVENSSSQTSWDLRAAFTQAMGTQTNLTTANSQTQTGGGEDGFGSSAPKQARRETACVQPLSLSTLKPASPCSNSNEASGSSSGASGAVDSLRQRFTIKPKAQVVGMAAGGSSSPMDQSTERVRATATAVVNTIDWRGTYTEQTLQSDKTYYERGRASKKEADQEFPKYRNLDTFCTYLDAMLAFLLQVCAHEKAAGGRAESKHRGMLLKFIDDMVSRSAVTAVDLKSDPRWDIPLVLCHQSKAILANRIYEMNQRGALMSSASEVEKAIHEARGGSSGSSSPGVAPALAQLAKPVEKLVQAFKLLEGSRTSWQRQEELAEKHRSFFDRFTPVLTAKASLLELASYLDRCITEFRALRCATPMLNNKLEPGSSSANQSKLKPATTKA